MSQDTPDRRNLLVAGAATAAAGLLGGFTRPLRAAEGSVTQIAKFRLDPERAAEARKRIEELVAAVEDKEPDVLAYIAHTSDKDPAEVFFYEVYRDEAAIQNHGRQPHLAALGQAFGRGLFLGPAEVVKMNPVAGVNR